MKKITLFLMLAALSATAVLHAAGAEGDNFTTLSFACDTTSFLADQMTEQMTEQVESLTIVGLLRPEDFKTIDKCSRLKWLDLTDVYTTTRELDLEIGNLYSHIEKDAFRHTVIETLFLPKNIRSFALQSLSLFRWDKDCGRPAADEGITDYDGQPHFEKTINVYVTLHFPDIYCAEPIDGYYGCPMEFHLAENIDNIWEYIEEDGCIYNKDKSCLLKVNRLYGKTTEECTFDVNQIERYAFTYSLWNPDKQIITFSKKLHKIATRAFTYPATPYDPKQEGEETKKEGAIRLLGWVPPACDFVSAIWLNYGAIKYSEKEIQGKCFAPCKIIVPCKVRYMASTVNWDPYVIDDYDYGLLCGTMTPDDKEEFYSKLDPYAPRIEEISEKIGLVEKDCDWEAGGGFIFGGNIDCSEYCAPFRVSVYTKGSVPLTFVNPESQKEENVYFEYGASCLDYEVIGYNTVGDELFVKKPEFRTYQNEWCLDEVYWPEAISTSVILSWYENENIENVGVYPWYGRWISPVPNGSVSFRIKGNGKYGITGDLCESEKKNLYFTLDFYSGIEPTELQRAEDAPYYDLQGRQVAAPSKGIYIKEGKKVLVK